MILPSSRALRLGGILALGSLLGVLWSPAGWACVGALAALSAAVLADGLRLPREPLRWQRRVPARLSLHEPEGVVDPLQNLQPFPLEVRVAEAGPEDLRLEPSMSPVFQLPAHGEGAFPFTVTALRRGEVRLSRPTLRTGRVGGLAVRQGPCGSETALKVFPNVARLGRYEALRQARALSALGIHRIRQAGLGTEFDHLRSYTRDDDFRRIHWKATARRGTPITKIVRTERGQSVLLALDVSHWMGVSAGPLSRLDYAVDAALFLAHAVQRTGDRVGLALFSNEVSCFLAPSAKPGQMRRILEALYAVSPDPVHPSYRNLARHLLARRIPRSLVVVLTEPPDPESAGELVKALAAFRRRHLPLVVGFQDPSLADVAAALPTDLTELCRRLAARELMQERGQRLRVQRQHGLETLDVLPEALSVSLVNRYLELKRRGAI